VNSFLASGGDNFTVLAGGTDPVTTGDNDLTMLVDYFGANSPVTADTEPRTRVAAAEPEPYAPFGSWEDLVVQQFRDVAGRLPGMQEQAAWIAALESAHRTPEQLVVALLDVDVHSTESTVLRLYDGLLGRPPSQVWLTEWTRRLRAGRTVASAAAEFLRAPDSPYRGLDNAAFVDALYRTVLRRAGSAQWWAIWTARLDRRSWTRGEVAAAFVEGPEAERLITLDLKAVELFRSMLGRLPDRAEYAFLLAGVRRGGFDLYDVAGLILRVEEYADRVA
jgi:hypothetical protein